MQGPANEDNKCLAPKENEPQQNVETGESHSAASGSRALSASRGLQLGSAGGIPEPSESSTTSDTSGLDPRDTDLNFFHREAAFQQHISSGQFTKVRCVADCCKNRSGEWDGKVELYRWRRVPHA